MAPKKRTAKAKNDESLNDSMRLRLSSADKKAFAAAARREGRDLSNWLRWIARRAAGVAEGP